MAKRVYNPPNLFNSLQHGFSQITSSSASNQIFISGQVAWDENSQIVGSGDLAVQVHQTFINLQKAVHSVGAKMEEVMMLRIYLVHYHRDNGHIISNALKETFGTDKPPASTWVYVSALANPEFLIEVEAVVQTDHE